MDIRSFAKKHRDGIILGVILLGSLIAMMIQSSRLASVPERIGMTITTGIEAGLSGIRRSVSNTIQSVSRLRDLQREYDLLAARLDESQQQFRSMQALQAENRELKAALGHRQEMSMANLAGQVIGKDPGMSFSTLLVNRGSTHGLSIGTPVVAYQDGAQGLVGVVIEIAPLSAIVRPLVDPLSFVSARLSRTRYEGLLRGRGSEAGSLLMEYLDRESRNQINVGDEIITSGLNSLYPPNLRIGTVSSILGNSYETSLELEVSPFISFTRLENVFFLIPDSSALSEVTFDSSQPRPANSEPVPLFLPESADGESGVISENPNSDESEIPGETDEDESGEGSGESLEISLPDPVPSNEQESP